MFEVVSIIIEASMTFVNSAQVYSDKFTLSVVDLTQIDNATEEDKSSKIDYWARLFKAKTCEELQMLAQNDEYL